jgi:hypothetical protein
MASPFGEDIATSFAADDSKHLKAGSSQRHFSTIVVLEAGGHRH